MLHASDCAQHNMPAMPNKQCDCGVALNAIYEDAATRCAATIMRRMKMTNTPQRMELMKKAISDAMQIVGHRIKRNRHSR
jgi:hypothetical protein